MSLKDLLGPNLPRNFFTEAQSATRIHNGPNLLDPLTCILVQRATHSAQAKRRWLKKLAAWLNWSYNGFSLAVEPIYLNYRASQKFWFVLFSILWQLNHFDLIDIFHCHCHSRPLPAVLVQIYLKLYQAGQAQGWQWWPTRRWTPSFEPPSLPTLPHQISPMSGWCVRPSCSNYMPPPGLLGGD